MTRPTPIPIRPAHGDLVTAVVNSLVAAVASGVAQQLPPAVQIVAEAPTVHYSLGAAAKIVGIHQLTLKKRLLEDKVPLTTGICRGYGITRTHLLEWLEAHSSPQEISEPSDVVDFKNTA